MTQSCLFEPAADGLPKVKICGITRADEAEQIAALGADAIGLNFWPKSKRYISFEDAESWLSDLEGGPARVGVFVNAEAEEIVRILDSGLIDIAQLHGDETPDFLNDLLECGHGAFKALRVGDREMLDRAGDYAGSAILLDAWSPLDYGGTGEMMDWALGCEAVERWPDRKILLAGGLTPENIGAAVRQVRPFAVDVASGVESEPGRKNLAAVEAFIAGAKSPSC